jgi:hypothetical protein
LKDQLLQTYLVERKRLHKWYKKLLRRILNAMIIYRHNTGTKMNHHTFRVSLVQALFEQFADTERKVRSGRAEQNVIPRLHERHCIQSVALSRKKSTPLRRCVVCSKHGWRSDSRFHCQECDVRLCVDGCFEAYHS